MAGFYLLALASGIGLLAFAWVALAAKSVATLKVALLAAVAGGTVLFSLRPRVDRFEPPGPALTREAQPELFGVIEDVARATRQAVPRQVYAVPDVNAWVSTRGGVLGIGGRRVMGLGLPLLHLLTVDQLKAVLAHEFGHYGGGDTKVGRLVYHTRAGLGRTLDAVEGKAIAILFNLYGRFVMRVSTAVARHEEFAADRFAAQATSAADLAASLARLDRHGPLFPLFYASNLYPVIEEGYWAPIGEGFAAFCASAMFNDGSVTVPVGEATPNRGAGEPDAAVDDGRYDSHPPTSARIAALNAIGPLNPGRIADTRVAGSLLRESNQLEFHVFKPADEKRAATLKAVEWPDVTARVMVPRWQRIARERAHILSRVRIESPPVTARDVVQLGRTVGGQALRDRDDEDVISEVLFGIGCGVMVKLIEAGWEPGPSPSLLAELTRGTDRLDPLRRMFEIAHGAMPIDEWAAFCQKEGLRGSLAP
jgi:Zn-dependent protease with chaperone function